MVILSACSTQNSKTQRTQSDKTTIRDMKEEADQSDSENRELLENGLFMVTSIDTQEEVIQLYGYQSGKEYIFHYALSTSFMDKYGKLTSVTNITPGKAVLIGATDEEGKLMRVQVSDEVWEYPNVERFMIDEEREIFQIADSKYTWSNDLFVFSNGDRLKLSDIGKDDKLTVVGLDKTILAVVLTTGQGTLKLANTELFEGSYVQIGKKIFSMITKDMTMEIPEGTYTLSVAKDGWGGTTEIQIKRGEETLVDLDSIKGDGPSYGTILFEVDVDDAEISIDGTKIDASNVVQLSYGKHTLSVTAPGYDVWTRTLFVNSAEATISITLEGSDTDEDTQSSSQKDSQNQSEAQGDTSESTQTTDDNKTSSESQQNNSESSSQKTSETTTEKTSEKSNTKSKSEDDILSDYMSTLSSLLDSF